MIAARLASAANGPALVALLLPAGCTLPPRNLAEVFPPAAMASPWVLREPVWSGTLDEAAEAIGERDASLWGAFDPLRVWIAVYEHERGSRARIVVRAMSFETPRTARRAFEAAAPPLAQPFRAGDAGCWTDAGVMFAAGRVVCDVFGNDPSSAASPEQAAFVAGLIERRLLRRLRDDPK